jgi:hypothetical protein
MSRGVRHRRPPTSNPSPSTAVTPSPAVQQPVGLTAVSTDLAGRAFGFLVKTRRTAVHRWPRSQAPSRRVPDARSGRVRRKRSACDGPSVPPLTYPKLPFEKGLRTKSDGATHGGSYGEAPPSIGQLWDRGVPGHHNFWAVVAIQPLDVGIDSYMQPKLRVAVA